MTKKSKHVLLLSGLWGGFRSPTTVLAGSDEELAQKLANHVWSFTGDDNRHDYDRTFLQPFVTYTTPTATSLTLQTGSTYDWDDETWSVPVNLLASQIVKAGSQSMQLETEVRW